MRIVFEGEFETLPLPPESRSAQRLDPPHVGDGCGIVHRSQELLFRRTSVSFGPDFHRDDGAGDSEGPRVVKRRGELFLTRLQGRGSCIDARFRRKQRYEADHLIRDEKLDMMAHAIMQRRGGYAESMPDSDNRTYALGEPRIGAVALPQGKMTGANRKPKAVVIDEMNHVNQSLC